MKLTPLVNSGAALVLGLLFGAGAMTLMRLGVVGGLIQELVTGTWGWAIVSVGATWALSRGESGKPLRRWLRAWLYASLFLVATTVGWYGTAGTLTVSGVPRVVDICVSIAAAIALVGAFLTARSPLGPIAGLALPAGLGLVLLADPPRSWHSGGEVALWWTRQGLGIAVALAVVAFQLVGRKDRRADQAEPSADARTT